VGQDRDARRRAPQQLEVLPQLQHALRHVLIACAQIIQ